MSAPLKAVDDNADFEREKKTALHPNVGFPSRRRFLGSAEFPAIQAVAQLLND